MPGYETDYGTQHCSRTVCPARSSVAKSSDLVLLQGMTRPPVQIEPSVGATAPCWCSAHRRISSRPSSSSVAFRYQEEKMCRLQVCRYWHLRLCVQKLATHVGVIRMYLLNTTQTSLIRSESSTHGPTPLLWQESFLGVPLDKCD